MPSAAPNVNRLRDRARRRGRYQDADPVTYCVFDLLEASGISLMDQPLRERQRRLAKLLSPAPPSVLFVDHFEEGTTVLFNTAVRQLELEDPVQSSPGPICKSGVRTSNWVKVKRKRGGPGGAVQARRAMRHHHARTTTLSECQLHQAKAEGTTRAPSKRSSRSTFSA